MFERYVEGGRTHTHTKLLLKAHTHMGTPAHHVKNGTGHFAGCYHRCEDATGGSSSSSSASCSKGVLDVSNMEIILRGKQWDRAEDPTHRSAIHLLERNEALVTWLQPKVRSTCATRTFCDGYVEQHHLMLACVDIICREGLWRSRFLRSMSMGDTFVH